MNYFKITTTLRTFHLEASDIYTAMNVATHCCIIEGEEITGVELDPTQPIIIIVEIAA